MPALHASVAPVRRREILGVFGTLIAGACTRAEVPTATFPEPLSRRQARERLGALAAEYERAMADHGLHEWSRYAGRLAEGDQATAAMDKLRRTERAIFEEALDILQHQERTLLPPRQAALWRNGAAGLRLLGDPVGSELTDELEAIINGHRFEHGGRAHSRGELSKMSRSDDPRVRREVRTIEHALHVKAKPVATALLERRRALAGELRQGSFYDALLKLRGVAPKRLDELMGEIFSTTHRRYASILADVARMAGRPRPEPWDLGWGVERLANEPPDDRYPAERAMDVARSIFGDFGIDLDSPKLDITIRDFAFAGQAISVRVPEDVRLVVRPTPGSRFYSTLLHELGHAYAATRTTETHPLFKAYEWVPGLSDPAYAEGLAEVFGRLMDEPEVLRDRVGLTEDEISRTLRARRIGQLVRARRGIGWTWFERTALAQPKSDLDRLSLHVEHRHTGVHVPRNTEPVWATSPFLATYPVYTQSYLLASMMAMQVHQALRVRFGARWRSPEAGEFLTRRAVADGARWTLDEKLLRVTGRGLSSYDLNRFILEQDG